MKPGKKKVKSLSAKIIRNAMLPILLVSAISCVICYLVISDNMVDAISASMDEQWKREMTVLDKYAEDPEKRFVNNDTVRMANQYYKSIMSSASMKSGSDYAAIQGILDDIKEETKKYSSSAWTFVPDKGVFFTDSKTNYISYNADITEQPWYDPEIQEETSYYLSRSYVSKLPGKGNDRKVVSMVYVVRDMENDEITGYIGYDIRVSAIRESIDSVERGNFDIYLFSLYGDELYVSSENTDEYMVDSEELFKAEIDREEESLVFFEGEKDDMLINNHFVGENGFLCLIAAPKKLLATSVLGMMLPIFAVFLAGLLVMFISTFLLSKKIVNPLRRLIVSIGNVGKGELDMVLDIPTDDDMGRLIEEFNTTVVRMRHKAEHDLLTDVYNHEKFCEEAEKMLRDESKNVAILRLDMDQFKTINELFDWEAGNSLLKHIAGVMLETAPKDCIFGRQGGDVFHLCVYYDDFGDIVSLIENLREEICKFDINLKLYPHFGICLCNNRDTSIHILCDRAGIALKQIKGNILATYAVYDDKLEERIIKQKFVEFQKEAAMLSRQFFVQMQPKTNMLTDKIVGAEALVRWRHPDRGIIRPDEFIPVFEKDGYILNLDEFVWEESCRYVAKWRKKGIDIPVSVNVSRMHIFDDAFIKKLDVLTEKYNIPRHLLELEFTESAMLDDVKELYDIMENLSEMGFPLVMDDFASGYSSLNMLKALDFDVVKLDKEFVDEVSENRKSYQLVAATIGMLQKLNIKIVGEGIETSDQVEKLKNAGLVVAQGYYYSKPLNIDAFEEKLYRNFGVEM